MVAPAAKATYAEYLEREKRSETKHEYLRGETFAMAGGSIEHGRLAAAVAGELRNALRGRPCVVLSSDVRVRIVTTDRSTYADVTIVCGKPERAPDDAEAVVSPVVIVEVLSPSTETLDRDEKFAHYRRLASLREYVLVSQAEHRIDVFSKDGDVWVLREHRDGARVMLASVDASFDVDDVYRNPLEA